MNFKHAKIFQGSAILFVLVISLLTACGGGGGGGGAASDTTAPTVTAINPANTTTGVSVSAPISATFSEAIAAVVIDSSSFTLSAGATNVTGTISYNVDNATATFTPAANLAYSTTYTATITTSVMDAAGNSMSGNYTWTFTTSAVPDINAPTVTANSPANNATGVVLVNAPITVTFDEAMDASTLSVTSFTLDYGGRLRTECSGAVSYSGTTATFTPTSKFAHSTTYTAILTTAVKDAAGNALASNHSWTFTTTTPNNDSGITAAQCYEAGNSVLVSCTSINARALNPAQDGMLGRDADTASNSDADGKLGFSYTKIDANGAALPASATSWSCVQDNVTGLIWEVKTNDGGLRDWAKTYTNYDSTTALQINGTVAPLQSEIDAATNSVGFKNAVNSAALCGASDWRLPTADELQSMMDYGVAAPGPTIDANWFPNTKGSVYWSATPYAVVPASAWLVDFRNGSVGSDSRIGAVYVRLVRAGQ